MSLECSRPGASAVALWATQKLLPLLPNKEKLLPLLPNKDFAKGLSKARNAALALYEKIISDGRFKTIFPPELDILVWAPNGGSASQISKRSEEIFHAAAEDNLHLAIFKYPSSLLQDKWTDVTFDQQNVTCLRSCLMKPEHYDWVERIWSILDKVAK